MRYAEFDNLQPNTSNVVRFVLPPELADAYTILPPNAVEIALDADVCEGDVYENGTFRKRTDDELKAAARIMFNFERDTYFANTLWVRQRHADRVDLGVNDTANWTAWLEYWQDLRDMPEAEGFDPRTPVWPVQPE